MKSFCLLLMLFVGFFPGSFIKAQENQKPALRDLNIYFSPEKKYLVLPVKNNAPQRNVELWVRGINERYFNIELADSDPDWYAYLQIDQWIGDSVELRVSQLPVDSKAFSPLKQSDLDSNKNNYSEKLRGQLHFSPKRGWTNDPNGMVYYKGEYHLFYQHNPYGVNWGNMTWGHAVSKDLVHWKELDDAIHPGKYGPVFSGGGLVDENNTSGLGSKEDPAMVLFYTGAKAWSQCVAWSKDGRQFTLVDPAVVPRINKDNRDPKVIWYEPSKKWIMVLYVELDNGIHSMQFLSSPDLLNWTKISVYEGGRGDDRYMYECPEFFELPVEGSNETRWVLTGANSEYAIGSFDGIEFKPEAERLNGQRGRDFYAAQTFSNEPKGRRIEMGWWRTHTGKDGMSFNQSMSIPMELKLVNTPEGIRLSRWPVKELEILRSKSFQTANTRIRDNSKNPLQNFNSELAEISMIIEPGNAKEIVLEIRGVPLTYDVKAEELTVNGVKALAPMRNGRLDLLIFADRTGLEIFANKGLLFMPVNLNIEGDKRSYSIKAIGGTSRILSLNAYELKSIWTDSNVIM